MVGDVNDLDNSVREKVRFNLSIQDKIRIKIAWQSTY